MMVGQACCVGHTGSAAWLLLLPVGLLSNRGAAAVFPPFFDDADARFLKDFIAYMNGFHRLIVLYIHSHSFMIPCDDNVFRCDSF